LGSYFQYAFGNVGQRIPFQCVPEPCLLTSAPSSRSAHDIRFGLEVRYFIALPAKFHPWIGAGIGYEILSTRWSFSAIPTAGAMPVMIDNTFQLRGIELVNLRLGAEWSLTPRLAVGPFAGVSLGQFDTNDRTISYANSPTMPLPTEFGDSSIEDKSIHGWVIFGVGGAFDF
jgi:hypothetical protein